MLSPRPGLSPRGFTAAPFSPFAPLSASSVTFLPLSLSLSRGTVDVVCVILRCLHKRNANSFTRRDTSHEERRLSRCLKVCEHAKKDRGRYVHVSKTGNKREYRRIVQKSNVHALPRSLPSKKTRYFPTDESGVFRAPCVSR